MYIFNPALLILVLISSLLFTFGLILVSGICFKGSFTSRIVGGLVGMTGMAIWFLLLIPSY